MTFQRWLASSWESKLFSCFNATKWKWLEILFNEEFSCILKNKELLILRTYSKVDPRAMSLLSWSQFFSVVLSGISWINGLNGNPFDGNPFDRTEEEATQARSYGRIGTISNPYPTPSRSLPSKDTMHTIIILFLLLANKCSHFIRFIFWPFCFVNIQSMPIAWMKAYCYLYKVLKHFVAPGFLLLAPVLYCRYFIGYVGLHVNISLTLKCTLYLQSFHYRILVYGMYCCCIENKLLQSYFYY